MARRVTHYGLPDLQCHELASLQSCCAAVLPFGQLRRSRVRPGDSGTLRSDRSRFRSRQEKAGSRWFDALLVMLMALIQIVTGTACWKSMRKGYSSTERDLLRGRASLADVCVALREHEPISGLDRVA